MMDTQVAFFDRNEEFKFMRDDAYMLIHHEDEYYVEAAYYIDDEKPIESGMYVALRDLDGAFQLFIIQQPSTDVVNQTIQFVAELAAMIELRDEDIIKDRRPNSVQAGMAVSIAIEKTEWKLGTTYSTAIKSPNFYYQSPWECLQEIAEAYGCYFRFRVLISDTGISGKYVDVLSQIGRGQTGMRLEIDKNTDSLIYDLDESDVATALYGRGKGEEVGTTDTGDPTYGRRITFADVVWSKANGDPCDKPAGQEFIEDVEATAKYGRKGRRRYAVAIFSDCEDPNELIKLTWDQLQARKAPKLTLKLSVKDLEDIFGYKDQSIRLGDFVIVILDDKTEVVAQIVSITRDRLEPENTKLVIGNEIASITTLQAATANNVNRYQDMLDISAKLAGRNPDLLNGILNTMVTQILSTGTKMYTDPSDGSLVFESDDGGAAVRLTGRGILIANERDGDKWKWTTAIDGNGIVASVVNSGVLNAAVVRILGNDSFYWDSQAIFIFDPQDETKNKQIRIGCFDGTHYGIGFTRDGGRTWQSAISFDGVILSNGSVKLEMLDNSLKSTIEDKVGSSEFEQTVDGFFQAVEKTVTDTKGYTDERLQSYSTTEQMNSALSQTAEGFTQTVEKSVTEVKEYADSAATSAKNTANQSTDEKLKSYSTTEQMNEATDQKLSSYSTTEQMKSEIKQSADSLQSTVNKTLENYYSKESVDSAIRQDAESWKAEFHRVGLAGGQTGITKADEKGVTVRHSNIGGETQMNADGFRLYDASGRIIGGLYALNGKIVSAVQSLLNPNSGALQVTVAPQSGGDEQLGLHFIMYGYDTGVISGSYDGFSSAFRLDAAGQLGLRGSDSVVIAAGNAEIRLDSSGGINFYFAGADGVHRSVSIEDIYWSMGVD